MKTQKFYTKAVMLMLIITAISGCKTTEFIPVSETVEKNVADVEFVLRYVSEAETIELMGKDFNPYYGYPGKIPRKQFFIFDTTISSESSELEINLRDITISLDGGSSSIARSLETLDLDWKPYYKTDSERSRKKSNMRKTMSRNTIVVTPDQPFHSWIVFLPSVSDSLLQNIFLAPKDGPSNALMLIPAKTPDGDVGVVDIEMNIGVLAGIPEEDLKPVNTGIFEDS